MTGTLVFWHDQPSERTLFEYSDDLSLYSVLTMIYHGEKVSVVRKDVYRKNVDSGADQKIESWHYHFAKDQANSLRQVDTYWPNTNLVKERHVFDESGALKASAFFEYESEVANQEPDGDGTIPSATRMVLLDGDGEIQSDYRESIDIDIRSLYASHDYTNQEVDRRVQVFRNPARIPVLVLDGGIDVSHEDLAYKVWRNPREVANGEDDDGDGLVDDLYGVTDNTRVGHPIPDLRLPRYDLPPLSHGTLVASVLAEGREDIAIMSASEVTTLNSSVLLPRVERFIHGHGVRFTNMSFVFDIQLLGSGRRAERTQQLTALIEHTPKTLHVIAAGNGAPISGKGFNVDKFRQQGDLVPAMLPYDNTLVVGALNTNRLNLEDYPTYELAEFSNVGEVSVDILAPGVQICGARMGGGNACESGTSFAAPYVLNHGVLDVAKANPALSIYEIKEILMKTAYVPDLDYPFPVRSGGIVHPLRAVAAARWMAEHPSCSVIEAVLAVRRAETHPIRGERTDESYLRALRSFWALRELDRSRGWYAQLGGQ